MRVRRDGQLYNLGTHLICNGKHVEYKNGQIFMGIKYMGVKPYNGYHVGSDTFFLADCHINHELTAKLQNFIKLRDSGYKFCVLVESEEEKNLYLDWMSYLGYDIGGKKDIDIMNWDKTKNGIMFYHQLAEDWYKPMAVEFNRYCGEFGWESDGYRIVKFSELGTYSDSKSLSELSDKELQELSDKWFKDYGVRFDFRPQKSIIKLYENDVKLTEREQWLLTKGVIDEWTKKREVDVREYRDERELDNDLPQEIFPCHDVDLFYDILASNLGKEPYTITIKDEQATMSLLEAIRYYQKGGC